MKTAKFVARVHAVKVSQKGQRSYYSHRITIPRRVVELLKLKKGDYLKISVEKIEL